MLKEPDWLQTFVLMPSTPRADRALPLIVMPTITRTKHQHEP
jgi:hypothetical protein